MPEIATVTRRYRFAAAHRLHTPLLSDDENRRVFGKCNNPFGHGHNYTLDVSVRGPVDPVTGRVVVVESLDRLVKMCVLDGMAWRNLNTEVDEFATVVPTTENLAKVIAARLARAWPWAFPQSFAQFEKVRIWETRNNIFEERALVSASDKPHPGFSKQEQEFTK